MPIDGRKSRGGVDTSLRWFTDRAQLIRRFLEYIYGPKPVQQALYFWGDGGNGKSKLLEMLNKHFCKYLPEVEQGRVSIEHETYERLRQIFEGGVADRKRQVVTSFLDFDAPPQGEDNPKEAFSALFMLRRALGSQGVKFPRFDYAGVLYLQKNNKLTSDRVKQLFSNEEYEFVSSLADLVADLPVMKQINDVIEVARKGWALLGKRTHTEDRVTLYLQSRGVDKETVEWLQGLDPEFGKELYNELPALFAADLNEAIERKGGPARIVLFFDTLEALNRQDRNAAGYGFFRTDEWLRRLVRGLAMEKGIVVVVAGRDPLRWPEAPEFEVEARYLDVRKVDLFSEADAEDYLTKRQVADAELRKAIIAYASATRGEVHPLLLGMAADVVELAEERDEVLKAQDFSDAPGLDSKERLLINRMLKYMEDTEEYAIRALSVCRVFDYEIYERLGEKLHFQTEMPRFKRLTEYSFVTQLQQGEGREAYRIHGLLRRLFYEQGDELIRAADGVMEEYYRERVEAEDKLFIAEAIYHANRLHRDRGVSEWIDVFEDAIKASYYELSEVLLDIRGDLVVETAFDLGDILRFEADYLRIRSRYGEAFESYEQALEIYDKVIALIENPAPALSNKGITLAKRGELNAHLSRAQAAEDSYTKAIEAFDLALGHVDDNPRTLNNKGLALARLADLQASLSKTTEAKETYVRAIEAYDAALYLSPNYGPVVNNKGLALERLGELQAHLSQSREAEATYAAAIEAFDRALTLLPGERQILSNKGNAFAVLGDLQASMSRTSDAQESYQRAIVFLTQSLALAPDDPQLISNRGHVLQRLGDLQFELSDLDEAENSYELAIATYETALTLAPVDPTILGSKGLALQGLGDVRRQLSRLSEAEETYEQAIQTYDRALTLAPDSVSAWNNKILALLRLGNLQEDLSRVQEAEETYEQAIQTYDRALTLAPNNPDSLSNKGLVLQSLGGLQIGLSRVQEAEETYEQAIQTYDRALTLAPDDPKVLTNKGSVLRSLATLQENLSRIEEAEETYGQALQVYDQALAVAPNYVIALDNKAKAAVHLSELHLDLGRVPDACTGYSLALGLYQKLLAVAPKSAQTGRFIDWLTFRIGEICMPPKKGIGIERKSPKPEQA